MNYIKADEGTLSEPQMDDGPLRLKKKDFPNLFSSNDELQSSCSTPGQPPQLKRKLSSAFEGQIVITDDKAKINPDCNTAYT